MTPARALILSAAILVFASPELCRARFVAPPPYLAVTALLTLLAAAFAVTARGQGTPSAGAANPLPAALAGSAAAAIVAIAAYRWAGLALWLPYQADMLIAVREATRRVLNGHSPYVVYRAYDAPWDIAMPYGPALWGPYVAAQLLRLDFRLFTIAGELFVPLWCGIAASIDAWRGRTAGAAGWLAVLAALVLMLDVQRFSLIGHTPVYWPLFLPLAWFMARGRWLAAACTMGLLVIARTTMVAMMPVFLFAAFRAGRARWVAVIAVTTATIVVGLAPFAIADIRGLCDSMVLSYPRVMKAAVWPVLARPGVETIGITESLLEAGRERLIAPVQLVAMLIVWTAAAVAIRGDRRALPWMALALFMFSMTTLYPVHYLYYDVLLLLTADAAAQTVDGDTSLRTASAWLVSLGAIAVLLFSIVRAEVSPFPRVVPSEASRERELRSGFSSIEYNGESAFSWIAGHEARIVLPRSSAAAADIVLTAESPFEANQPPQHMTALLNGTLVADVAIPPGRRQIRIPAARAAWWVGYNELRLVLASTIVPRDVGAGNDRRPLALSISGIVLEPSAAPAKTTY